MTTATIMALGVFMGNWLLSPLFRRTLKEGFIVGVIAGILTFFFCCIFCWLWSPSMIVN